MSTLESPVAPQDKVAVPPKAKTAQVANDLLVTSPFVTPKVTNGEVAKFFHDRADIVGLAVVEDDIPIGLINRNVFMEGFARPFARDVFSRKSCIAYMDKSPLIVDGQLSIDALSALAIGAGEKVLKDGFILTQEGRYSGIGTGFDLLSTLAEMQAAKNRIIMESIEYASVIQRSFLRQSDTDLAASLGDYFMWWEPRDVVGGDCYLIRRYGDDDLFFALIDCTGHGVPGAFMTLIVMSALDSALETMPPNDPAALLREVNVRIKSTLGQSVASDSEPRESISAGATDRSDDGFDGGFGWFSRMNRQMVFAGAKSSLLLFNVGAAGLETVDGDRMGVGYTSTPDDHVWTNQSFDVPAGTRVYLATDGLVDQIGGDRNIAFGRKRLRELLRLVGYEPMHVQHTVLADKFREYQGTHLRRDDVTMFGFRVE